MYNSVYNGPVRRRYTHGIQSLTVRKIETARPRQKAYLLKDGGSLFLRVQPSRSRLWWYRYRVGGAAHIFSIGVFPKVTLEVARKQRDWARTQLPLLLCD